MDYFGWWDWVVSWFTPRAAVEPSGEGLLEAARIGDARMVRELLAAGTLPDATRTPALETALSLAARHGHAEVARALLMAGADPGSNGADATGVTPLIRAADGGHHEVIRLIAARRPDLFRSEAAAIALRRAALGGHPEAVRALLAGGVAPDASPRGLPPAIFAAATADAACVLELLEAGANAHAVDNEGKTPLHHAAAANEDSCVRVLLTADANLDANLDTRDYAGRTPLDLAGSDFVRGLLGPVTTAAFPPAGCTGEFSKGK